MIVIVDFGAGNLQSVKNALNRLGVSALISDDKEIIAKAQKVIFPGQGHFGSCIAHLREKGLFSVVQEVARTKPFLGICVGMQLLFEQSEEAPGVEGLGILKGAVKKFQPGKRIPHMGWNRVISSNKENEAHPYYYFAHSYYCVPKEKEIIMAETFYNDEEFVAIVKKEQLQAVQFHPEKSGKEGLKFLEQFLKEDRC